MREYLKFLGGLMGCLLLPFSLTYASSEANANSISGSSESLSMSCPSNDMISGRIFLDTFYQAGSSGAAFEEIKVFLIGEETVGSSEDIVLDSMLTNSQGSFEFTNLVEGQRYILMFENLPNGYTLTGQSSSGPARANTMYVNAPNCDIFIGLSTPKENINPNANVAIPLNQPGAALGMSDINKFPGVFTIPYSPTFEGIELDNRYQVTFEQIGSCWGLDYQCSRGRVYTSAQLKRHSGLGPYAAPIADSGEKEVDVDGVYMIEYLPTERFLGGFTLQGVSGIDLGQVTRGVVTGPITFTTDSGDSPHSNSLSASVAGVVYKDSYDLDAFDKVAKVGFGSATMGPDDAHLWLVNLYQNSIIKVDVRDDASIPTDGSKMDAQYVTNFPMDFSELPACDGDYRPWALEFHAGYGYLGVVCDGSGSDDRSSLVAYVLRFVPSDLNVLENEFELVLSFDLDYRRESIFDSKQQWNTWVDEWPTVVNNAAGESYYAQPILSDIEFTSDNRMVISLMDRFGHQTGLKNFDALIEDQVPDFVSNAAGDVLMACLSPANDGTYEIEGLGDCTHTNDTGTSDHGSLALTDDGPSNNGEYFPFDHVPNYSGSKSPHNEVTIGASAIHPHFQSLLHTAYDPITANYSQGVHQYDLMSGELNIPYQMTNPDFSKANGMGDLALISSDAPMEVGNYVWIDANKNGIQETWEEVVPGVNVSLLDMDGNVLATVQTDQYGEYYINERIPGLDMEPWTMYHLVVGIGQWDTDEQLLLGQYEATTANSSNAFKQDKLDSDFENNSNAPDGYTEYPSLKFTTGTIGYINHTFDFGLVPVEINCPGISSLALDNNDSVVCSDEDLRVIIEHSNEHDFLELVYSTDPDLTANELYYGDRPALGIKLIDDELPTIGTSTTIDIDMIDSGVQYIYVKLPNDSEYVDDPNCLPFSQTSAIISEEFILELSDYELCAGSDLIISSNIVGGIGPFSYLWSTGETSESISISDVMSSADYLLTVTDAYGCAVEESSRVTVNPNLNVDAPNVMACIGSMVQISATPSGGNEPYTYLWSNGSTDSNFNTLLDTDKNFSVTVTDANGCQGIDQMQAETISNLVVETAVDPICEGSEGQISVSIQGGSGDYTLTWTPSFIEDDGRFNQPLGFNYSLSVSDNNSGCSGEDDGTAQVEKSPVLDLAFDEISCVSYTLPAITGLNLSPNAAYYTQTNKMGTRYLPGDVINSNLRLYIYDENSVLTECNDEQSFLITIVNETPNAVLTPGELCREDSPYTPEEETLLDLRELILSGPTGGTWSTNDDATISDNRWLTINSGSTDAEIHLNYYVAGDPNQLGTCGDKDFQTIVNIDDCYAKLGDFVWNDKNYNGIQDNDEPGIPNVKITLVGVTENGDNITIMDTTDSNGNYLFCYLPEGDYKVTFSPVPNFEPTILDNETSGDDLDSDADPDNMLMSPIYQLNPGDSLVTVDAGFIELSKLGDFVWHDLNADGIQDQDEPGIDSCKVILTGTNYKGEAVDLMTQTDETGMYMFCDLLPGTYKVTFPGKPEFFLSPFNDPDNLGDDFSDSDADPSNGNMTEYYDLEPGDTIPHIDAGFYQYAAVGDYVWFDDDRDGRQDGSENCADSVRVYLFHCDDPNTAIDSLLTVDCRYLFDSLMPGEYFVKFVNPDPSIYEVTGEGTAPDDLDSDVDLEDMRTPCTDLSSGEVDLTLDMGLVTCPSLDTVSCIGDLQISIGQDGCVEINPGMLLSINYYCENLEVNILDSIGNDYGNMACCELIGKDLIVMVSDPASGNSCWSRLTLEDKIPPIISCPDPVELECGEDPDPGNDQIVRFETTPGTIIGPNAGSVTNVPINIPELGNLMISGVNIYMDITMTSPLDYIFPGGITLTSPQGTVYDVYPFNINPNCQTLFAMTGVDHGYDDGSLLNFAVCQDFQSQDDYVPFGANLDATFAGEEEQGQWMWSITDQFDLQGGIVNRLVIELELQNAVELPRVTDNCDYTLDYEDVNDTRNVCGIGAITRRWTVTDGSGNSSSCDQVITFVNNVDVVVTWPSDYEVDCFVDPSDLDPEDLPRPFDIPRFDDDDCAQVAVNHTDQEFNLCSPYGYSIRRTWSVLDWCNPDPDFELTHEQIITVIDTIAPQISCPDDMVLSLRHNDCELNVSLPQVGATDNCDTNPTIDRFLIDQNGVVIPTIGVSPGNYRGMYIASDACGNADTCFFNVSVHDPVPPVATCFKNIVVSLTSNGWAYVCADQIDDGSNDNCTDVGLQIKNDSEDNWAFYDNMIRNGNCVRVTCRDIGTVTLVLRVWDDADGDGLYGPQADTNGDNRIDENDETGDNYSECWSDILVEDKLPPTLVCPADITINCLDDYQDLNITGEADADGNCSNVDPTYTDVLPHPLCPGSIIEREWRVEKRLEGHDGILNTADDIVYVKTCVQDITLEDTSEVVILKLPGDLTFSCDQNQSLAVNDLTRFNYYDDYLGTPTTPEDDTLVVFDRPVIDYDCEQLAINYTDQRFVLCASGFKMKRLWTIEDACDPDYSFTHEQIILVQDVDAPTLVSSFSGTDITESGRCDADVTINVSAFDNCGNVFIYHNSPYGNSPTDPSGVYPKGTHTVVITARDQCGNTTTEELVFTVSDQRNPVAACKFGLSINLKADGTVSLDAENFDAGSYDNCTMTENLIYEIEVLDDNGNPLGEAEETYVFDCSHLGNNTVNIIVIDDAGNESSCQTAIHVSDNGAYCSSLATYAGEIRTEGGDPISEVEVFLNSNSAGIYNGSFNLPDNPALASNFIECKRDFNYRQGVNTLDLLKIRKHILQVDPINSPYQLIAANVNNDDDVNVLDMLIIRQLILRYTEEFTDVESWHFIPEEYSFDHPDAPWEDQFNMYLEMPRGVDKLDATFVGVKMGDVNGTVDPQESRSSAWKNSNEIKQIKAAISEDKNGIELTIAADQLNFVGGQLALDFNSFDFEFIGIEGYWNDSDINVLDKGQILISWLRESQVEGVSFKFERKHAYAEFGIGISSDSDFSSEVYNDLKVYKTSLKITNDDSGFELLGNKPNPFNNTTEISFRLPADENVQLVIYDQLGREVLTQNIQGEFGWNTVSVHAESLKGKGIYYYELTTRSNSASKKMMLH